MKVPSHMPFFPPILREGDLKSLSSSRNGDVDQDIRNKTDNEDVATGGRDRDRHHRVIKSGKNGEWGRNSLRLLVVISVVGVRKPPASSKPPDAHSAALEGGRGRGRL